MLTFSLSGDGLMTRRKFIAGLGAAAPWPVVARAQQVDRLRRVAVLTALSAEDPETKANMTAFRQELEKRGWVEGRNLHIDYRFAVIENSLHRWRAN
jgi:putative ABC transport system substrate-binding protein